MRRRRNADEALRKAERAYLQDPNLENKLSYWKELLRIGRIPEFDIRTKDYLHWDLGKESVNLYFPKPLSRFPNRLHYRIVKMERGTLVETVEITEENALRTVKKWIRDSLLGISNPLKRRKNADDNLRKLERKAVETEDTEDILRYWRASLKAGKLPAPTRIEDYNGVPLKTWMLFSGEDVFHIDCRKIPHYDLIKVYWSLYVNGKGISSSLELFEKQAEDYIKGFLSGVVQRLVKENPRPRRCQARNADDGLRRLERLAASGDFSASCRLTETRLRAGITQPTRPFNDWLPTSSGIYDFCNGWSVWYGGNDLFIVLNEASSEANRGSHVTFGESIFAGLYLSLHNAPGLADGKIAIGEAYTGQEKEYMTTSSRH